MVSLQVFGSLDLKDRNGDRATSLLAQPKRLGLFVYLALEHPRGLQRRDRVLALFWPELNDERARAALSQALHYLRRSVGEELVQTRGMEEIGLDLAKVSCDALEFEERLRSTRFEQAMNLYTGEFLQAFHLSDLPEFGEWVERQRDRYRRSAIDTTWKLADESNKAGNVEQAIIWARRAHQLDAYGEASLRRLVSLLDSTGHRAEAVGTYKEFADRLRRDLDSEPAPESQAVLQRIQQRKGSARVTESHLVPDTALIPRFTDTSGPGSTASNELAEGQPAPSRPRWTRGRTIAAGAALSILLVISLTALRDKRPDRFDSHRVFVSSFANRTGDHQLDAAGLLVADWIIEALQRTSLVEVVDPATAFAYGHEPSETSVEAVAAPLTLAAQTGAGTLVSGSFYKMNDSIYFHAQIVDANRKTVLATVAGSTGPVNDPLRLVYDFRERVTGALASALDARIATLAIPASRPPTLAAYEEYIAGLGPFIRGRYAEALPHFHKAEELDSTFILPRFWAIFALNNDGRRRQGDSVLATVLPSRNRLSRMDQFGLDYLVAASRGDLNSALAAAKSAAELGPQSNWQYLVGYLLIRINHPREAILALNKLDPEHGWIRGWLPYWAELSNAYHMAGDYEGERRTAVRAVAAYPNLAMMRSFEARALAALGHASEAVAIAQTLLVPSLGRPFENPASAVSVARELDYHGNPDAAKSLELQALAWFLEQRTKDPKKWPAYEVVVAEMRVHVGERFDAAKFYSMRARTSTDSATELARLAIALAYQGDQTGASRIMDRIDQLDSAGLTDFSPGSVTYEKAEIAAIRGDAVLALTLLKQSFEDGYPIGPWLHRDIRLISLRHTPEFRALIKPKG